MERRKDKRIALSERKEGEGKEEKSGGTKEKRKLKGKEKGEGTKASPC